MAKRGTKLSNFQNMNMKELRRYVLEHRDDEEAWNEFASRPRPNAISIPADTSPSEIERIIKELANKKSS